MAMDYNELLSQHSLSELRRLELRTKRNIDSDLIGKYRTAFRGSGLIFSDLREYQPGDDIRNIHWKVTARTGTPHIKTFEEDRQLQIMLAVDISNSTNTGSPRTKHSRALEFSALITLLSANAQDSVGLCLFSDQIEDYIPPNNKRSQFQRIISSLLVKRDLKKQTEVSTALRYIMKHQRKSSIVFLVSDFYSAPFEQELKAVALKHDLIGVCLVDDVETQIPNVGIVEFEDSETGQKVLVDTSNKQSRDALVAQYEARQKNLQIMFRSVGADFISINKNLISPLAELIKLRTRRH